MRSGPRRPRQWRGCRCTPDNWPCDWCQRDITRREITAIDPDTHREEEELRAAERSYERWLDEIGGSR